MARPDLYLRAYAPGDIDRFIPRADFLQERAAVAWEWSEGPPPGRSWALVRRGDWDEIRGVGGLFDAGSGIWHAWAILAPLSAREFCVAGPLAEDVLAAVELFNAPDRITATARIELPGAQLLLEKLGFDPNGVVTDQRVGDHVRYRYMVRAA